MLVGMVTMELQAMKDLGEAQARMPAGMNTSFPLHHNANALANQDHKDLLAQAVRLDLLETMAAQAEMVNPEEQDHPVQLAQLVPMATMVLLALQVQLEP